MVYYKTADGLLVTYDSDTHAQQGETKLSEEEYNAAVKAQNDANNIQIAQVAAEAKARVKTMLEQGVFKVGADGNLSGQLIEMLTGIDPTK